MMKTKSVISSMISVLYGVTHDKPVHANVTPWCCQGGISFVKTEEGGDPGALSHRAFYPNLS